jgi:hypothetical protein
MVLPQNHRFDSFSNPAGVSMAWCLSLIQTTKKLFSSPAPDSLEISQPGT